MEMKRDPLKAQKATGEEEKDLDLKELWVLILLCTCMGHFF